MLRWRPGAELDEMRTPRTAPAELVGRPFHRDEALELGVTSRQLQNPRFIRVFPSVYRLHDMVMTPRAWVEAAQLTLPADARVSHHTRFLSLGLQVGPLFPLHFTVPRDLHLAAAPEQIFLHRTIAMPEADERGVSIAAAVTGAASVLRLLDVVAAIDWLAHRDHLRLPSLLGFVTADEWRPGVDAVRAALNLTDPRARSLPESEVRTMLVASGLPAPESNVDVYDDDGTFLACADLLYRALRLLIEYEGRQHAFDVEQFERDIHRFSGLRRGAFAYLQITASMRAAPVALVRHVHSVMLECGYDGSAPVFGEIWHRLVTVPERLRHERRHPRASVAQQPSRASIRW